MRPIGGELELKESSYHSYFTDSGRSSLRLFLRSGDNDKKKYLLPNFFCDVIEKVFIEESIEYEFYNILDDLTIDIESVNSKEYDVFYIINYFGASLDVSMLEIKEKILLEDNVFLYNFENQHNAKYWFAFNSFRKITALTDGSMVKTNLKIDKSLIVNKKALFVKMKQSAKAIKYDFIYNEKYSEEEYLNLFTESESLIDRQEKIYRMSHTSQEKLISFQENRSEIEKRRYELMFNLLSDYCLDIKPKYFSFFILKLKNRDEFRKKMMNKGVFLAIHWPKSTQENHLYNEVVSIPLFLNYTNIEFNYLLESIKESL